MPAAISEWLRRGATAVAVSRVGVGVVAFAAPALVSRSWVGGAGDGPSGRVLGRALGGRDLALGLGALAALRLPRLQAAVYGEASPPDPAPPSPAGPFGPDGSGPAAVWVGLAALADGLDLLTTVRAWHELPPLQRWLVALSSGGAAAVGAAAAAVLLTGSVPRSGREAVP